MLITYHCAIIGYVTIHKRTYERRIAKGWTPEEARNTPSQRLTHDLSNQRFGRLAVLTYAGMKPVGLNRQFAQWHCQCDCGNSAIVTSLNLKANVTKSCGCLQREVSGQRATTHGHYKSPEYRVWQAMLDRCRRPNSTVFKHYGGRGISVCDRWVTSFQHFWDDMGPCPVKHQLDRINNDGNYEPGNCRWATKEQNIANRRNTRLMELEGESLPCAEVARRTGIPYYTIRRRALNGLDAHGDVRAPSM